MDRPASIRDRLPKDPATPALNVAHTGAAPNAEFVIASRRTPIQAKAFELIGLRPSGCRWIPPLELQSSVGTRT